MSMGMQMLFKSLGIDPEMLKAEATKAAQQVQEQVAHFDRRLTVIDGTLARIEATLARIEFCVTKGDGAFPRTIDHDPSRGGDGFPREPSRRPMLSNGGLPE